MPDAWIICLVLTLIVFGTRTAPDKAPESLRFEGHPAPRWVSPDTRPDTYMFAADVDN